MRTHRPPDQFGLPPNYRWINEQPHDPPPGMPLGNSMLINKEHYCAYLSDYSHISHSKSNRVVHDFSFMKTESCVYDKPFREQNNYFN